IVLLAFVVGAAFSYHAFVDFVVDIRFHEFLVFVLWTILPPSKCLLAASDKTERSHFVHLILFNIIVFVGGCFIIDMNDISKNSLRTHTNIIRTCSYIVFLPIFFELSVPQYMDQDKPFHLRLSKSYSFHHLFAMTAFLTMVLAGTIFVFAHYGDVSLITTRYYLDIAAATVICHFIYFVISEKKRPLKIP
ncbi:hypothetical protein PFISCL1PPCAC_21005, partial [Pristionchus fissidentatus]